jgi:hypothetical protein
MYSRSLAQPENVCKPDNSTLFQLLTDCFLNVLNKFYQTETHRLSTKNMDNLPEYLQSKISTGVDGYFNKLIYGTHKNVNLLRIWLCPPLQPCDKIALKFS